MDKDTEITCKILRRLVRDNVVGSHKKQVNTVKNWVATSDQGRAEDLIREMITDPDIPLEGYGGSRDNVRLTSINAAVAYMRALECDIPWGYG